MDIKKTISKKELRSIFPTMESLYNYLESEKGVYLPYFLDAKNRDQSITIVDLFDILTCVAFSVKREAIKKPPRIKKTILKCELQTKIEQIANQKCFLPKGRSLSKDLLVEVLYSLNPKDELFSEEIEAEKSAIKEISESLYDNLKSLPRLKVKNALTFRLTPSEREKTKTQIKSNKTRRNKLRAIDLEEKKKSIEKTISLLKF